MKLTKVSLAALVALSVFSSVASATPLEEAIKNVDLSGLQDIDIQILEIRVLMLQQHLHKIEIKLVITLK